MTILIITGMDDVHADAVIPKLELAANAKVVRLNTDNFAQNAEFSVRGSDWAGEFHFQDSRRAFRTDEVAAVWYRKPVPIRSDCAMPLESVREFVSSEHEAFMRSVFGLLEDAFWVSDYWKIRIASQKLPNLRLAAKLGLRTPRTFVSSRREEARRFAAECGDSVLAKPFGLTTFKLSPTASTSWDTFAARVDVETFEKLSPTLGLAPTILQEYIDKQVELRVTVVGRKVFCTSINSQAHAYAREDWRAVDAEELEHSPYKLPPSIEEKLLLFNRARGLEFATHDLIVDREGEHVWLEANPNGQWLWIEQQTGQPIASAIVDLLIDPPSHGLCV